MKVVICYKLSPESADIKTRADHTLELGAAEWSIGQYDLPAVEAAAKFAEQNPGTALIALTAGGDITDNSKLRKSILARGPQELRIVRDARFDSADCYATASALAAAIRKIGDVDLAVFGEGSGDLYAQQTGCMVGAILGWHTVNSVNAMEMADGCLQVSRSVEECNENLRVAFPAAVSVTSDICMPRLASMRDILAAGKKPCQVWTPDDLEGVGENGTETKSVLAPEQTQRKKIVAPVSDEGHVDAVVKQLKALM